ncbi:DNA-3-methyladenine glycosidase [Thermoclostridium stercorarium subsp. leptospartum DSM 9219]|uniref:DNA-3-methyladenine glycosylase II n=1 Tax=Thermoclostridium stercorarium subsp. leptospartum DSM 9219 TaxID=1346611 RepID=A0A1B1YN06_THEST|nr:DNA-3-methyladenine glycosylase [Thermoclostridium stercorarium]ANX02171.1 DNA-3-methyladenine glycosidase [Thermoclostridium stercorarium subsp. leptospartum DSM 9219]
MYFEYGEKETEYLKERDKKLGEAIDRIGFVKRRIIPDPFRALVYSIVGQQIIGKAADTVFNRLVARAGEIAPERLAELDISEIKACGMSLRKAEYIRKIAEAAVNGTVDFGGLKAKPDREVIDILTTLPGVGIWTAEMLLIFSLARPNVLSFSDFGIRKGLMKLHGIDRLTKEKFDEYRSLYSPYCTTASIYLWEIAKES